MTSNILLLFFFYSHKKAIDKKTETLVLVSHLPRQTVSSSSSISIAGIIGRDMENFAQFLPKISLKLAKWDKNLIGNCNLA